MLATLGGLLALALGLAILLLPLLTPELSRPRDAAWGALVLLLGLDLVTSADRLSGAPMLGVLCGALLIGRLGSEVAQARWRQLSDEERQELGSAGRWRRSLDQLLAALTGLIGLAGERLGGLQGALAGNRRPRAGGKRWVRPEQEGPVGAEAAADGSQAPAAPPEAPEPAAEASSTTVPAAERQDVREVSDFGQIDALLLDAGALDSEADGVAAAAATPAAATAEPANDPPQPDAAAPADGGAG